VAHGPADAGVPRPVRVDGSRPAALAGPLGALRIEQLYYAPRELGLPRAWRR
jgi:hypothetical protein